jgi:hypothetical protein
MQPPSRLHRFRMADWLTPEEMADLVTAGRQHEAFRAYMDARAAWCAERGLTPYEMRRLIPPQVVVDGGGRV